MPCWQSLKNLVHELLRGNRLELSSVMRLGVADTRVIRAPVFQASTPQELDQLFEAAQARGNEGLMIKDPRIVPILRGVAGNRGSSSSANWLRWTSWLQRSSTGTASALEC